MSTLPSHGAHAPTGGRRCRCGHLPTAHMRVVALGTHGEGNWRLEPSGSCETCGSEACPKFRLDAPRHAP